jgi:hypothetical protein
MFVTLARMISVVSVTDDGRLLDRPISDSWEAR